jgi:hypothetical protein
MRIVLVSIGLFISFEAIAGPSWSELALRFTAESQVAREQSIKQLRKIRNLESILAQELERPKRYLALDVIGTLRLYGFIPILQKLAQTEKTGMIFVTLNSLMTIRTQEKFIEYYLESLDGNEISFASKVVVIDTLSRLKVDLGKRRLKKLFRKEEFPEVRSSVLNYIRAQGKDGFAKRYHFELVEEALEQDPFQVRLQAWFLVSELPRNEQLRFHNELSRCSQDPNVEVRRVCANLQYKRIQ